MTRYLRGRLVGEGEQLAVDGQPYPFVHMESELVGFELSVELWGPSQNAAQFVPRGSFDDDSPADT
jgi:hypothetical protein